MATKPNKNIKVSQSTIDQIKKMGMTAALKEIKNYANQGQGTGAAGKTTRKQGMNLAKNSEFAEGVRRMYGDRRSAAARTQVSPSTMRGPSGAKTAPKMLSKPSTKYSPAPMTSAKKAETKKATAPNNTKSNILKGVAGTAAAVGVLALGRGKGAGLAAKLSPGLAKSGVGKALMGGGKPFTRTKSISGEQFGTLSIAAKGKAAAAAGKGVTPGQYKAMQAVAKAKDTAAAGRGAAKKTVAKKAAAKKTGLSAGKRFDANAPKAKAPKPSKKK